MAKQKKDVGLIIWAFGWLLDIATRLRKVSNELSVPFEAFERLTSDEGEATLKDVVSLIRAQYIANQLSQGQMPKLSPQLPPNHYRVRLTYAPMPPLADLKKEFGEDNVSDIYDGRPFTLHASCQEMDRTPGEKVLYLHDAGGDWESEERIAWGLKQRNAIAHHGYRPATREETYEFAKAHPEIVDFVGLGSFAMRGDRRCVAYVWRYGSRRVLGGSWFGRRWLRRRRVLFVAKEAPTS